MLYIASGKVKLKITKKKAFRFLASENLMSLIVLIGIYAFLLNHFKLELLLLKTSVSGGDIGSMNYLAKYMRDYLLPHGKIFGWSQGRWCGYPMFQFIPPLAYVIASLLSYLIPLEIAFKIVTVSGVFSLPLVTFLSLKFMKFKFPIPIIASVFSLFFLFNEKNAVFGGNIPSVLAGEFSYSISFSLMVLFFGLLYKTIEERRFSLIASIVYGFIFMTHLVTAIIATLTSLYFLLTLKRRELWENLRLLLLTLGIGLLLIAFWLIPAIARINYTTKYGGDWPTQDFFNWYPKEAIFFHALALFSVLIAIKRKDKRIFYLLFILLVSLVGFMNGERLFTANVRYWPMLYFFILLIAAYPFDIIANWRLRRVIPLVLLIVTIIWISNSLTYIDFWIKWNYEGFESKATWPILEGITNTIRNVSGRVYNDLNDLNDRLGTVRVFESIPYFSGTPTLEGVYAQSTITSPFISYTQCEISKSCAGIPTVAGSVRATSHNITAGMKHLEILNVKYLIAIYDVLKSELANSSDWKLVRRFGDWEIYELLTHNDNYVVAPKYLPNLMEIKEVEMRKKIGLDWWQDLNLVDVPIVFVDNANLEDKTRFAAVISNLSEIKWLKLNANCKIEEKVREEEIVFTTSCIDLPHIIKISYYPNWKVEGADKIYYVSPSFMLVYPKEKTVRLYYSDSIPEYIGKALTLFGIVLSVFLIRSKKLILYAKK
jgi:hypothetical protein